MLHTIVIALTVLLSESSQASTWFKAMLSRQEWKDYQTCLHHYQKVKPGIFPSLDLVRFDLMNFSELTQQTNKYSEKWKKALAIKSLTERKEALYQTSLDANRELFGIFNAVRKEKGAQVYGSRREILESIPAELRQNLTPLDPTFRVSVVGEKLFEVLDNYEGADWVAFSYDKKNKRLFLEGIDENRGLHFVRVLQKEQAGGKVALKFESKGDRGLASPVGSSFDAQFTAGYFFGKDERGNFPFGPFVGQSDVFVDEGGRSHFSNDGHKQCNH